MKRISTNEGFSLIEMMVVVGIMGILAMVAVPNLMRFSAKAKQANAKSELASLYGLEKAFYTEFSQYNESLSLIGYAPDGVPLTKDGCVDETNDALWPTRFYSVGFVDTATTAPPPSLGTSNICGTTSTVVKAHLPGKKLDVLTLPAATTVDNSKTGQETFDIGASGVIGGKQNDIWEITDNKILTNSTIGY